MKFVRRRVGIGDQDLSDRIRELQGGEGRGIDVYKLPPQTRAELVILSYLVSTVRDFLPERPYLTRAELEARITDVHCDLSEEGLRAALAATATYWEEAECQ